MARKNSRRDSVYFAELSRGGIRAARRARPMADDGSPEAVARRDAAVKVARTRNGADPVAACNNKRAVHEFSAQSRQNMRRQFNALPWDEVPGRLAMVTLTYPRAFPSDGKVVKGHLHSFRKRWEREFGPVLGAWAIEWQERGAPHFHLYVGLPNAAELSYPYELSVKKQWPWALAAWDAVVKSGDQRHARQGVDVRPCFYGGVEINANRIADYFWRESGKRGQKEVPEGYTNVGRIWGRWGASQGFVPVFYETETTVEAYVKYRRALRKLWEKRVGRKAWRVRGFDGLTVFVPEALVIGVRMLRWAEGEVCDRAVTSPSLQAASGR